MSEEGILVSLGYVLNDATLLQLRGILSKCDFTNSELESIINLNDKLKIHGAYIAMSNSNDYFKIKNQPENDREKESVRDIIFAWANKHKINLEKVQNKETYYILGRK
ncbi:type II secretion system protein [Campylobacter sp. FMV-PI01]|uniref:Type II secretion system protein n=1 Tax=Campylobacter portucalensis TaxID=2608384 RepID=A0A6L5WF72_9BACT|nr:type II secretion system protein [Campylobacter portucalensis]MSN95648.1 type II secretion system protein [Campylobacter portucalensis]